MVVVVVVVVVLVVVVVVVVHPLSGGDSMDSILYLDVAVSFKERKGRNAM